MLQTIDTHSFNEELLKMICTDDVDDECCLIDGDALENNHITLKCGHKFNYFNIFNEVKCQKTVKNNKEIQHLKKSQIKCPYCRNIQNGILPHIEGYEKIKNVNTPEKYVMKNNKCNYVFKSGKRKGLSCNKGCYYDNCKQHIKYKTTKKNIKKFTKYKPPVLPPPDRCKHLLTNGKNKGFYCSCLLKSQYLENGYCGKHIKKHI
jgi:sarcosine oxidase delta subunit